MRLPRLLDAVEVRVLGALLEKEQTTPEVYPLTLNALVAACNQRSNRDPVMELAAGDVEAALDRLHEDVMVWPVSGARSQRWRHNVDRRWELEPATKAVLTVLLLRGPQTPGELRSRCERMHPFDSPPEVEQALSALAEGPEALVRQLPRQPGQKEARWAHLVASEPETPEAVTAAPTPARRSALENRLAELEARVERLEQALAERGERG